MSARVMPASTAVLCPTVMLMSKAGAVGVSGCDADIHGANSFVFGSRIEVRGNIDWECVPPAMTTSCMPATMSAAAVVTALSPEAQCRLRATPGMALIPSSTAM